MFTRNCGDGIEKYKSPVGDGNELVIGAVQVASIEKYKSPVGDGNDGKSVISDFT